MPGKANAAKAELKHLEARIKRLTEEKSCLRFAINLIQELSLVPGQDKAIESVMQIVLKNTGGLTAKIYYKSDEHVYYTDAYGNRKKLDRADEPPSTSGFSGGPFLEAEQDCCDTTAVHPASGQGTTELFLLKVGKDWVGVLELEGLPESSQQQRKSLSVVMNYVALLLQSEIQRQNRLQEACEPLSRMKDDLRSEIGEREKMQTSLLEVREEMERRVSERTEELRKANKLLWEEITERKQVESALVASKEKFSKAFRQVAEAIGIVRLCDEVFLDANDAFFRILGYQREEVVGRTSREFDLWSDIEKRLKFYDAIRENPSVTDLETMWRTKSGEMRIGLFSADLIDIDDETCLIFIWHDITQRKQAEEEVRQARDQLEAKVAERTRELHEVNKALSVVNEEVAKMNEELQRLTLVDGLTGIANRRCFDEFLAREWQRGLRWQKPISLIMADIDFFKIFNDTYGHLQGDECLKTIAAALSANIKRPTDLVSRYGGEEFAIILPDTDVSGAIFIAEHIRSKVAELQIENRKVPGGVVTVSLGAASLIPESVHSPATLIAQADKALYAAKSAGRNCVRSFA